MSKLDQYDKLNHGKILLEPMKTKYVLFEDLFQIFCHLLSLFTASNHFFTSKYQSIRILSQKQINENSIFGRNQYGLYDGPTVRPINIVIKNWFLLLFGRIIYHWSPEIKSAMERTGFVTNQSQSYFLFAICHLELFKSIFEKMKSDGEMDLYQALIIISGRSFTFVTITDTMTSNGGYLSVASAQHVSL